MNADMNDEAKLVYPDLSYKVRGCFFNVHNELGFGHKEVIYQRALAEELHKNALRYVREKSLPIKYNSKKIGEYRPDFLVENKIIVEVKAVEYMPRVYEKQLTYYLKSTSIVLGFLVNFGSPKLEIVRRVWSMHFSRQ